MKLLSADDPRMVGEFRLRARRGAGGMGDGGAAVMIYRVVHGQPVLDGMPPRLRDLAAACLAKDPAAAGRPGPGHR